MKKVIIVGVGSLGSTLVEELIKKSISAERPINLVLIDDDEVEARNIVSQNFRPEHLGHNKASVLAASLGSYGLPIEGISERVTEENFIKLLNIEDPDDTILVDAVDNIETRQLLWQIGVALGVPVLHLGMSQAGGGLVSWNFKEYDTFDQGSSRVSPAHLEEMKKHKPDRLPPCMLNAFRPLIWNTAMAAAISLFMFCGVDSNNDLDELHEGKPFPNILTTWESSNNGFQLDKKKTSIAGAQND